MKNRRIKLVLIIGFIYLFLLVGVNVVKELNNTKKFSSSNNTTITNETSVIIKEIDTKTDDVIPDEEEVFEEVPVEDPTEAPLETTQGTTEGTTPGTTKGTTKGTTTTKKTTTTTKSSIPSKISCSSRQIISQSREEILSKIGHPYNSNTCLKWNSFKKGSNDTFDGSIPTEWLGDPVYVSMAMPGESLSNYMVSAWRDNAHDMGVKESAMQDMILPIGAVYMTQNASLPDSFTLNFGKIKLFGYSKSKKKWVTISSLAHPNELTRYTLPWTSNGPVLNLKSRTVDHGSYVSVTLNKDELNDNYVIHFWGSLVNYDRTDYSYYASAFEVWTSTASAVGGLTSTSGIDTKKNATAATTQLYSSYGMKVTTSKKVLWGHTIPMSEYDYYRDGVQLQNLFNSN